MRVSQDCPKRPDSSPRSRMASRCAVVFNNNARDYALRNALRFTELLHIAK